LRLRSPSPEATREAARRLAEAIESSGLVVALIGELGTGKTVFAKGLAEGLGIDPGAVASPTFVIASEYPRPRGGVFAHVDVYRLRNLLELEAAGFRDLLAPGAVVAVEWGDRVPEALPEDRMEVRIARDSADASAREIEVTALGPSAAACATRWRALLARKACRGRDLAPLICA